MRNWFRGGEITSEVARKITGISTPFGGLQWAEAGPSETDVVRNFLVFLEDRRVLYNAMLLEVSHEVETSIHQIREECTRTLQRLKQNAFAAQPIRAIRAACRRYHDDCREEFRHLDCDTETRYYRRRGESPGFFVALGAFRATVGQQVALLAAHYDLSIEGDLAGVIPGVAEGSDNDE